MIVAMRRLAGQYRRYGYRRIQVLLAREGFEIRDERSHRLWRKAVLQVPKKRQWRRVATARPRPLPSTGTNHVWAYDFIFDACADGQQLKYLAVVDKYTRECLPIDAAGSSRSWAS